jgi:GT2 family glycosyltransferase
MSLAASGARVAVVVPNWNGRAHLGATLDALRAQTRPPDDVVVVDNGSTDGSAAYVAEHHPHVRLVRLARNTGFAGAANAGWRGTDAELVVVLNNDARPAPDWLEQLLRQPDDPDVWAWGSVLVSPDGTVESAGDHYDPRGYAYKLGRGASRASLPTEPYDVVAPPGACPLMRRSVLQQLGGYCDRFFLYYEDVDLSLRALLAGRRAVMVPAAVVEHDLGRSSAGSARPWFYVGRNSLWCAVRCQPEPSARALWQRTKQEWRTVRSRGGGRAYLAGRIAGLGGLAWALRSRRAVQATRVLSAEQVGEILAAAPDVSPTATTTTTVTTAR